MGGVERVNEGDGERRTGCGWEEGRQSILSVGTIELVGSLIKCLNEGLEPMTSIYTGRYG